MALSVSRFSSPTLLREKNPKKSHFFLIRKFRILRDPPAPLSEFFRKKTVFFLMPPLRRCFFLGVFLIKYFETGLQLTTFAGRRMESMLQYAVSTFVQIKYQSSLQDGYNNIVQDGYHNIVLESAQMLSTFVHIKYQVFQIKCYQPGS